MAHILIVDDESSIRESLRGILEDEGYKISGSPSGEDCLDLLRKTSFDLVTPKKAARKQREKQARSIVDGRSLRAKGRTEQLNVKVRPDIKQALADRVETEGITIADWLERMLETALRAEAA